MIVELVPAQRARQCDFCGTQFPGIDLPKGWITLNLNLVQFDYCPDCQSKTVAEIVGLLNKEAASEAEAGMP